MLPAALLPPAMPSTDHCTAVLLVPKPEAENCWVAPAARVADSGEMLMLTAPGDWFRPLLLPLPAQPAMKDAASKRTANARSDPKIILNPGEPRESLLDGIDFAAHGVACGSHFPANFYCIFTTVRKLRGHCQGKKIRNSKALSQKEI